MSEWKTVKKDMRDIKVGDVILMIDEVIQVTSCNYSDLYITGICLTDENRTTTIHDILWFDVILNYSDSKLTPVPYEIGQWFINEFDNNYMCVLGIIENFCIVRYYRGEDFKPFDELCRIGAHYMPTMHEAWAPVKDIPLELAGNGFKDGFESYMIPPVVDEKATCGVKCSGETETIEDRSVTDYRAKLVKACILSGETLINNAEIYIPNVKNIADIDISISLNGTTQLPYIRVIHETIPEGIRELYNTN